jgi:hypothetical protein
MPWINLLIPYFTWLPLMAIVVARICTVADDAFFEFLFDFPGWPRTIRGRANLMAQYYGYGRQYQTALG